MKKYFAVLMLLALISCTKDADQSTGLAVSNTAELAHSAKAVCKTTCAAFDRKICDTLSESFELCMGKNTEANCNKFVDAFAKTLPKTVECTSTCTDKPYKSAIANICDIGELHSRTNITERAAKLLAKLNYKKAQSLFLSEDFAAILDGDLAEDLRPLLDQKKQEASTQ